MNKKLLIGAGVLAVAGVAYYMWKKNKDSETSTETKANAVGTIGNVEKMAFGVIPVSKLKKGDKWYDSKSKECCRFNGDTIKCTPAPCTISSNA
jgi:uncharacterized protein (UPF0333 family)